MLKRHALLQPRVQLLHDKELDDFLLTPDEENKLDPFVFPFVKSDSVTKQLQANDMTILDAQALPQGVSAKYTQLKNCLQPSRSLLTSPFFENGTVAIQGGREQFLRPVEQ